MKRVIRYQLLLLVAGLMGAFIFIAPYFDKEYLAIYLNSLTVMIGLAVVATYMVPAVRGAAKHPADRATQLILGIALMFLSLFVNRLGLMLVPHWGGSLGFSSVAFMIFLAGVLHLAPQFGPYGKVGIKLVGIISLMLAAAWGLTFYVMWANPKVF